MPEVITTKGMVHPIALPAFLCRPDLVNGIPVARDSLLLAADNPMALRQENDSPGIPPFRFLAMASHLILG